MPHRGRRLHAALAFALDITLVGLLGALALLAVAGPGIYEIGGVRLKLRTAANPATLALALAAVRITLAGTPFLTLRSSRWPRAHRSLREVATAIAGDRRAAARFVLLAMAVTAAARLVQAWVHPGFVTGDDVEIHDMTLRSLGLPTMPVWDLRCAFYPFTFIHPPQVVMHAFTADPHALVFAGRAAVALLPAAAVWLTWKAAAPLLGEPAALAAAALVAMSKLHVSYGSSELPRPIASVLLVAAFALLVRREGTGVAAAAGGLVGAAAAMRFSEALFVVPAIVHLTLAGRRKQAVIAAAGAAGAGASLVALSDWLYWGNPLQSVTAVTRFTLVDAESSRGFQSPLYYALAVQDWTNWIVAALAIVGTADPRARPAALWTWLPIAILSCLPHKEPRYLLPVIPFLAICAAAGLARISRSRLTAQRRRAVAVLIAGAVLYEIPEWRLRRSDDAVYAARYIAAEDVSGGVVIEQAWRAGGRLYLGTRPLLELEVVDADSLLAAITPEIRWMILHIDTVNRGALEAPLAVTGWARHRQFGELVVFRKPDEPRTADHDTRTADDEWRRVLRRGR